jgi:hypothetical protein
VALHRTQTNWAHRELWLRSVQGVAQGSALAHARLNDPDTARQVLERGRLQLLADRLPVDVHDAPEDRDRLPRVYVAVTEAGGMALLDSSVRQLDDLTTSGVEARVASLRAAYERRARDPLGWRRTFDSVVAWTRDEVVEPMRGQCRGRSGPLEVIATGLLAALPLIAAWEIAASADDPALVLAVGGAKRARRPMAESRPELLAVADPLPTTRAPLPNGRVEVRAAASRVVVSTVLTGRRATPRRVLTSLRTATLAHLVCHGTADREEPLNSRLHLGSGDITVDDLLHTDFAALDLVVLSACDSAVIGDPTPDESIGFPAALLAAGARGVIAASWAVDDLMATTLFCRFWETWTPGAHPAVVLAAAQRWLRRATNGELANIYPFHRDRGKAVPEQARRLWDGRRPYWSATGWAAFAYHGA